jgi:cytochrome c biogenesis protein CcmG, thiol:disulfide interchange protein DsbE
VQRQAIRKQALAMRLAATVGALVIAAACGDADELSGPPVPDRAFQTFHGATTSLADLDGPLVVNFWASWCPPCVAEMPDFERVHQDVRDEVRFVGINTQDARQDADRLVEQTGVTYDLVLDPDGDLFRDFEVVAMPSTFFVDASGAIVHRHAGLLTEQQLRGLIDEHLGT